MCIKFIKRKAVYKLEDLECVFIDTYKKKNFLFAVHGNQTFIGDITKVRAEVGSSFGMFQKYFKKECFLDVQVGEKQVTLIDDNCFYNMHDMLRVNLSEHRKNITKLEKLHEFALMNLDSIDSERCLRDFNLVEQKLFNKQQVEKKFNIAELKLYPAVFTKSQNGYLIAIPNCKVFSQGDSLEDGTKNIREALTIYLSTKEKIPDFDFEEIKRNLAENETLIIIEPDRTLLNKLIKKGKAKRVNITIDEYLLEFTDLRAKELNTSRSALIESGLRAILY